MREELEKHKVGREDGSSILIGPWLPLRKAPSPRSPSPFPTPKRTTRVAPQQSRL